MSSERSNAAKELIKGLPTTSVGQIYLMLLQIIYMEKFLTLYCSPAKTDP